MTGNPDLSREDDIPSDFRAACQADLRAKQRVFPDHAGVPNLNQVIDLGAAFYAGLTDRRAIYR